MRSRTRASSTDADPRTTAGRRSAPHAAERQRGPRRAARGPLLQRRRPRERRALPRPFAAERARRPRRSTAEQLLSRALTLASSRSDVVADDVLGDLHERWGYSRMVSSSIVTAPFEDLTARRMRTQGTAQRRTHRSRRTTAWFLVLSPDRPGAARTPTVSARKPRRWCSFIVVRADAVPGRRVRRCKVTFRPLELRPTSWARRHRSTTSTPRRRRRSSWWPVQVAGRPRRRA